MLQPITLGYNRCAGGYKLYIHQTLGISFRGRKPEVSPCQHEAEMACSRSYRPSLFFFLKFFKMTSCCHPRRWGNIRYLPEARKRLKNCRMPKAVLKIKDWEGKKEKKKELRNKPLLPVYTVNKKHRQNIGYLPIFLFFFVDNYVHTPLNCCLCIELVILSRM